MQAWDGRVKGMPSFSRRAVSVSTLHQPRMSVSGASFLPRHLVFSHFKFFASNIFGEKKVSRSPLAGCLYFIPRPSQLP